jgi:uncharacterized membrane protein YdjX (TVP38/TMEM64 family)
MVRFLAFLLLLSLVVGSFQLVNALTFHALSLVLSAIGLLFKLLAVMSRVLEIPFIPLAVLSTILGGRGICRIFSRGFRRGHMSLPPE